MSKFIKLDKRLSIGKISWNFAKTSLKGIDVPHKLLVSNGLYDIPTLPDQLKAVGFTPGATGYRDLKHKHESEVDGILPNVRTVQKMFKGKTIKYAMCDGIIKLLNVARNKKGLPLLDGTLIAEHEWYIDNLEYLLTKVTRRTKIGRKKLKQEIAQTAGIHSKMIKALLKKERVTKDVCESVQQAVNRLYGEICSLVNDPFDFKPGRRKRKDKATSPKDR
ncbi:MAG: hypothetical protein WDN06_05165 [Asticcacaulis sp.]